MKLNLPTTFLLSVNLISIFCWSQTTNVYTSATTWTVPTGVTSITIKVYGGAGGAGGQDCGNGCTNASGGPVGYLLADYSVSPGNIVGIYPGGKGADGADDASGDGGGIGGVASYNVSYNGGIGGDASSDGSSGGGGGGGAASIVTISSVIKMVAGGGGGGGGMANMSNSGQAGSASTSSNGTNTGGNGTTPVSDGGGGGGGGGGQFASAGGGVHAAGGESAGDGGFRGGNSITGATTTTTNGSISWSSAGRIEITYNIVLPVTWLSFVVDRQGNGAVLTWSTAAEQNTKEYKIQRSGNGSHWNDIGTVAAAGNSNTERHYSFTDQTPAEGLNFYRLLQQDVDNSIRYSKVVTLNLPGVLSFIKIYPNPVLNSIIKVQIKEASRVEIFTNTGIKVMEREISAGETILDVSKLSKGIYYMRAKGNTVLFLKQ